MIIAKGIPQTYKSLKTRLSQYQLTIFFVLVLLIGWSPWYTRGGTMLFFSPAISAILVIWLLGGKKGLLEFMRRIFRWRVKPVWYLVALFAGAVTSLGAVAIFSLIDGTVPTFAHF